MQQEYGPGSAPVRDRADSELRRLVKQFAGILVGLSVFTFIAVWAEFTQPVGKWGGVVLILSASVVSIVATTAAGRVALRYSETLDREP